MVKKSKKSSYRYLQEKVARYEKGIKDIKALVDKFFAELE